MDLEIKTGLDIVRESCNTKNLKQKHDKFWVSAESLVDYIKINAYDNGKEVSMILDDEFRSVLGL